MDDLEVQACLHAYREYISLLNISSIKRLNNP